MYLSTRGNSEFINSAQAISLGMVPEGGLFVPETFPQVNWQDYLSYSYPELALAIMEQYLKDFPLEELKEAVKVYTDGRFTRDNPAPLVDLGGKGILELWHGPSAAFKDMALQVLPHLLATSVKQLGIDSEVLILTATSGDTGKAALEGFKDVEGAKIMVFYPEGGVSPVQERQMITTNGSNTYLAAVKGNFDECQTAVKRIFASSEIRNQLQQKDMILSSANSINWGRLLPQIVYYVWLYLQAVNQDLIKTGQKLNVVVPTGNFGNILAAYYAQKMGLPLGKLICAANKNNVLTDFFKTGTYQSQRPFYLTISPSMDILISSNLERFLFETCGRDAEKIQSWYKDLAEKGRFEVDSRTLSKCREEMAAGWADEAEVRETIKHYYEEEGYLADPHTAVGLKVYEDYRQLTNDETYTVMVSTASPFKFAQSVLFSLQETLQNTVDSWEAVQILSRKTGWKIPAALQDIYSKPVQTVHRCTPHDIDDFIVNSFAK